MLDHNILVSNIPGAKLTYRGGLINANPQVIQVLWGKGNYDPHIIATSTPSIASFFEQITINTAFISWLNSEYKTPSQNFSAGTFVGLYSITPSLSSVGFSDDQIQTEIAAQIESGYLPPPSLDSQGNPQTYYAIFFPPHITIALGDSISCVHFCAYHSAVASTDTVNEFFYGVHPDFQVGSDCNAPCGTGTTFEKYCQLASHELSEMITDPAAGVGDIAWYDDTYGEIGDVCNDLSNVFYACDGQTYSVQLEYSNAKKSCVSIGSPVCVSPSIDPSESPSKPSRAPSLLKSTRAGPSKKTTYPSLYKPSRQPVLRTRNSRKPLLV